MPNNKNKYYVVWIGMQAGVYNSWSDCKKQVDGYKGAKYKGFETRELAEEAFRKNYTEYIDTPVTRNVHRVVKSKSDPTPWIDRNLAEGADWPVLNSWSVDAACSGNPGKMEYRGVYTATGQEIFKAGPFEHATNNIGEFLAIVHGLALLKQKGEKIDLIYSDSVNGMSWVKQKKCKTKLTLTSKNAVIFDLIKRAETWLENNVYDIEVRKWKTELWGEIPADFGRK